MAGSKRVVAVTGACTFLGTELLRGLEEDPTCTKILALDIRPPAMGPGSKIEHIKVDLTQPTVDSELATLLQSRNVDTVVHAAAASYSPRAG
ncbi:MAG TPA: NAD-dependent epimerase/dehydratase family protein, partial [Kofleriaceae bacterium]|nr:NAD-dependent epimerase/dehydratase family protein [Kofleriaceae bacterium]